MLSRSGYEMLPITHGEIVAEAEKIQFYCELYNVHEVVDSMFLVSCWIEDIEGQVLPGTRRFFRKVAAPILPLFTSIPMPEIGEAKEPVALVVQALTRENQPDSRKSLALSVGSNRCFGQQNGLRFCFARLFADVHRLLDLTSAYSRPSPTG